MTTDRLALDVNKSPLTIGLVSQQYPPETARGGIGTQTWNKARALAKLGHTVHVLSCASRAGPELQTETQDGVVVHRMQPPGQEPGREFSLYQEASYALGYTWSVLRHLSALMETIAFDVLDFPDYGAEGFAYQLDRSVWNWVPVVVQLHAPMAILTEYIGWPEKDSELFRIGSFMEETSIRLADGVMACSANIADFTARYHGVPRETIDVVHCGVDAEAFRPGDETTLENVPPTVLFVGNIAHNKGVGTVFDAVLRLRSKYPQIRLQILGSSDGDLKEELQSRVREEGAEKNILFPGFVDRAGLPDYYRHAHAFCSPAQYEGGVANVYLEAMACGCPVVASTAGGAPEAVIDGSTGLLVPPQDVSAVTLALDRLLADEPFRRRLGRTARQKVTDYFAMNKYTERVLATYEKARQRAQQKRMKLETANA